MNRPGSLVRAMLTVAALVGALVACPHAQAMNCAIVSSPQFAFGPYDSLSPMALDVQASLVVQCTPATPGQLLNLQVSLTGASQPLQMVNAQTGERLIFVLYADAGRTQAIDGQQVFAMQLPLPGPTLLSLPVYGRVPARQGVSVGTYQSQLAVVLNF